MFVVINNDNLTIKKTLKEINKKLETDFKKEEFKKYNNDYILNLTDEDLNYKRDIHQLDKVFVGKLYKKDNSNLIVYGLFIITLLLLVITMSSVSSIGAMLEQVIKQLPKGV